MTEPTWQKSSFSEAGGTNCVYIAAATHPTHTTATIHLRESDAPETALATTPAAFAALIRTLARK
ncbi:DUF397 domain-containing protein [Streptomyces longisporoflavus]|uniref:DUF397 domain-containing protein n=1 Tax=Streptomyces longisporoflavus TaxID=28044 RepID=A0ABW7QYM0_9ACTN